MSKNTSPKRGSMGVLIMAGLFVVLAGTTMHTIAQQHEGLVAGTVFQDASEVSVNASAETVQGTPEQKSGGQNSSLTASPQASVSATSKTTTTPVVATTVPEEVQQEAEELEAVIVTVENEYSSAELADSVFGI